MGIYKMIDSIVQYIFEAVMRIFAPSDDAYPAIGVQAFTGDFFKPLRGEDW